MRILVILGSPRDLVCTLLVQKKKKKHSQTYQRWTAGHIQTYQTEPRSPGTELRKELD